MSYAIINGAIVPESEAKVLISDLSIQRGYGIFDYFRTRAGQPVFLEDHLDRLYHSASVMRLSPEVSRERLKRLLAELIEINGAPNAGIRITLTGGYSENGYTLASPNLLITLARYHYDPASFDMGIRLVTHDFQRQLPEVKTIDYLQAIYLQPFIREHEADDVLYHQNGAVRECPRANFWAVTENGTLVTPADRILKGVTRKMVLAMEDLRPQTAHLPLSALSTAREAFITSTTKILTPVTHIDGRPVGNGQPGPVAKAIFDRLLGMRGGYE
ncbi:aminotransferase class IV [Chitinophaga rhizosphaerae]|uniref:aminotransferase class IV n=1 Tax=Chitinophaga rhizosphaerae TaxID=1864947 RepID=UPI000F808943|nr:aminotransferase class IV [Chitinophaga rhizosphaerae]